MQWKVSTSHFGVLDLLWVKSAAAFSGENCKGFTRFTLGGVNTGKATGMMW